MAIKQYPYKLEVLTKAESVYDESTGEYSSSHPQWIEMSDCRDEGNGGGQKIVTIDGEVYVFGAVIYVPKTCTPVILGAEIRVTDNDGVLRLKGKNKLFKKGQLNAKLWV